MSTRLTLEHHLLFASGLLAIAVVVYINGSSTLHWPDGLIYITFAAVFLASSYDRQLGLEPALSRLAVLAMLALSLVALFINPDTVTLILSVVLMASAPGHLSPRQSWLLLLVANIAYLVVLEFRWQSNGYLLPWLALLALQGFATTSSLTRQREIAAQEALTRQNNELLAARAVLSQQSQAEERLRIAGELHDTIGHQLTALGLQLEALAHQCPASLKSPVSACQTLAAELLESIRSIVRRMSEERRGGLAAAIEQLSALTPGIQVRVTTPLPSLPAELTQQLVFCFQEAIHNAIRHGHASEVEIRYAGGQIAITDNGGGLCGAVTPGFGLKNIDKRLAPFGGSTALSVAPGGGCTLTLALPGPAGSTA